MMSNLFRYFNKPLTCDGFDRRKFQVASGVAAGEGTALGASILNNSTAVGLAFLNNHFNRVNAHMQYTRTRELQEKQQEFNAEEAKKARDWQEQMYLDYGTPAAMRKQYEEAGINPYMADTDTRGVAQSAPAGTSSAGGSVALGNSVDLTRSVHDFSEAVKALTEAKKNNIEMPFLEQQLQYQTQIEAYNAYMRTTDEQILAKYPNLKVSKEFQRANEQINKLVAENANIDTQTLKTISETDLIKWKTETEKEIARCQGAQREILEERARHAEEFVRNELKKQEADILTTQQQGNMFAAEGAAATENAKTNRIVGNSQAAYNNQMTSNGVIQGGILAQQYQVNTPDQALVILQNEVKNSSFYQWLEKMNMYLNQFPIINQVIQSFGGAAGMYSAYSLMSSQSQGSGSSSSTTQKKTTSHGNSKSKFRKIVKK